MAFVGEAITSFETSASAEASTLTSTSVATRCDYSYFRQFQSWVKNWSVFISKIPRIQFDNLVDFEKEPELNIKCFGNDELKQDGNTRDMIFSIGEILEFITSIMTLLPGDVVLTGTPEGVSKVSQGDEIRIEIDTIGTLTNNIE